MSADLLVKMCNEIPTIGCIKLEAVPTPAKIATIRKAWAGDKPPAGDCTILTGLGALYAGFDMAQVPWSRHVERLAVLHLVE